MRRPLRLRPMSSERISRGGKPKNEWMVWPPTFTAARPVGASTTASCVIISRMAHRRVDFPVPARPVTKRCPSSCRAKSTAVWNSGGGVTPAGHLRSVVMVKRPWSERLNDTQGPRSSGLLSRCAARPQRLASADVDQSAYMCAGERCSSDLAVARTLHLFAQVRIEPALAQADGARRNLDELVVGDVGHRLFQRELHRRSE